MYKILVVDDDKEIVTVLNLILQRNGFEVRTLSKGDEVYEVIKFFKPDVILLDVVLGNYNGLDICFTLKSNPETKDLFIILFSANDKKKEFLELSKANAFISKPFEIHTLLDTIQSHIKPS